MKMRKHNRAVHKCREYYWLNRKFRNFTVTFTETIPSTVSNFMQQWVDYVHARVGSIKSAKVNLDMMAVDLGDGVNRPLHSASVEGLEHGGPDIVSMSASFDVNFPKGST